MTEVASKAKELLTEFLDVQKKPLRDAQPRCLVWWNPPSEGMYKENFDGAIFSKSSLASIGVVIRDSCGNVIAAFSQKILLPLSIDLVEALAASRAVSSARELCISQMESEGDSKRVITAINNRVPSKKLFGHVIEEIWLLADSFQKCRFGHVKRKGNQLAHCLTRTTILSADLDEWVEDLSSELDVVLQAIKLIFNAKKHLPIPQKKKSQ